MSSGEGLAGLRRAPAPMADIGPHRTPALRRQRLPGGRLLVAPERRSRVCGGGDKGRSSTSRRSDDVPLRLSLDVRDS
jgi:hypothetical protein